MRKLASEIGALPLLTVLKSALFITIVAIGVSWVISWVAVVTGLAVLSADALWMTMVVPATVAFPTGLIFETQKLELAKTNARLEGLRDALLEANERLKEKAERDFLTGLANREAFSAQLDRYLARDKGGTLLFVDVDHFKMVNDTYGHDHGDVALKEIAKALYMNVRPDDLVGRYGGEEFVIYLRELSPQDSEMVAARLRFAVQKIEFVPNGTSHPLAISIGGSWCDSETGEEGAAKIADAALYSAKEGGRNRYHYAPGPVIAAAEVAEEQAVELAA